jgi:tetratricopeptide (TPR) repeat protein
MDAQTLFREGVLAIREKKDTDLARRLLMESLRLEPNNEMAWLWLSRTTDDRAKQLQCLDRALKINPANHQALELKQKLLDTTSPAADDAPPEPRATGESRPAVKPIKAERHTSTSEYQAVSLDAASNKVVPAFFDTGEVEAFFADSDEQQPSPAPAEAVTPPKSRPPTAPLKLPTPPPGPVARSISRSSGTYTRLNDPLADTQPGEEEETVVPLKIAAPKPKEPLSAQDQKRIKAYLTKADELVKANDMEGAIEQWVNVLHIRSDHEAAMANAVRYLSRMGYLDDVRELIGRAMEEGTTVPAIYMTAIDLARRDNDTYRLDELREQVVRLPLADDGLVIGVIDQLTKEGDRPRAIELLKASQENHPKSQKIPFRLAQLLKEDGQELQAMPYYNQVVRLGTKTPEGKEADAALKLYTPVIGDRERGSTWLAIREAFGVMVFYVLLAWQDAGLNLLQMGPARIAGIGLSLIGGYLLVTGTSAPQQQPLAKWLGGKVPEPKPEPPPKPDKLGRIVLPHEPTNLPMLSEGLRYTFAFIGALVLIAAFYLVFSRAIQLLVHPVPPCVPSVDSILNDSYGC